MRPELNLDESQIWGYRAWRDDKSGLMSTPLVGFLIGSQNCDKGILRPVAHYEAPIYSDAYHQFLALLPGPHGIYS